jgi:hypothetical protein
MEELDKDVVISKTELKKDSKKDSTIWEKNF